MRHAGHLTGFVIPKTPLQDLSRFISAPCARLRSHKKPMEAGLERCQIAAQADNIPVYSQANRTFHTTIHKASGNDWLKSEGPPADAGSII